MKVVYEDRILSFVDILGWSKTLEQSEVDESILEPIGAAIELVARHAAFPKIAVSLPSSTEALRKDLVASHFSDTLVVSAPATEAHMTLMIAITESICYRLLVGHHLIRGAVVRGKLHHDSSYILGPALAKAHEIESQIAKHPRIIVGETARPLAARLFADEGGFVRTDADGQYILDYFGQFDRPLSDIEKDNKGIRIWAQQQVAAYVDNTNIREKYEWLLRFLDIERPRSRAHTRVS